VSSGSVNSRHLHPAQSVLLVAPLLWIVIALIHPAEPEQSGRWIFVHFAQLVLTPFLSFAVWMLLDGIRSLAATVSRIALVAWMVFFSAYDSVAGIATGLLARHAEGLAGAERVAVTSAVEYLHNDGLLPGAAVLLAVAPAVAWPTTVIAAAVAVHRVGARRSAVAALCLSALFAFHASYPAAIGLAFFIVAAVLWERQKAQAESAPPVMA
jgi:hypothetical protein